MVRIPLYQSCASMESFRLASDEADAFALNVFSISPGSQCMLMLGYIQGEAK